MEITLNKKTVNTLLALILLPLGFILVIFIATSDSKADDGVRNQNLAAEVKDEVRIKVSASEFQPSVVRIPAGKDVKLIAENDGASGCTSSLISRDLFDGVVIMGAKGSETEKIIRAEKPGEYSITCNMGMVQMKVVAI